MTQGLGRRAFCVAHAESRTCEEMLALVIKTSLRFCHRRVCGCSNMIENPNIWTPKKTRHGRSPLQLYGYTLVTSRSGAPLASPPTAHGRSPELPVLSSWKPRFMETQYQSGSDWGSFNTSDIKPSDSTHRTSRSRRFTRGRCPRAVSPPVSGPTTPSEPQRLRAAFAAPEPPGLSESRIPSVPRGAGWGDRAGGGPEAGLFRCVGFRAKNEASLGSVSGGF